VRDGIAATVVTVPADQLSYDVVDVFTDRPFAGNPLAVVHGSQGLPTSALQDIAREFNLSETTFPVPVDQHTYEVRIFTPGNELPFAGHPTVGTAWVLRERGDLADGPVVQRCGAGDVGVLTTPQGARLSARATELGPPLERVDLLTDVGVDEADLRSPVRAASCGLGFVYVRVSQDAVRRSHPISTAVSFPATGTDDPIGGICVYAVEPSLEPLQVLSRVFCPEMGVPEDPATGSAAAGLGLCLVAQGLAASDGTTSYTITQGEQAGRPSRLVCEVESSGGVGTMAHVAGGVQPVARGTLVRPRTTP
jgi:trans-2,3-dihydro-3-hydroxyanthranilate isomerase